MRERERERGLLVRQLWYAVFGVGISDMNSHMALQVSVLDYEQSLDREMRRSDEEDGALDAAEASAEASAEADVEGEDIVKKMGGKEREMDLDTDDEGEEGS